MRKVAVIKQVEAEKGGKKVAGIGEKSTEKNGGAGKPIAEMAT